jgi:Tol biopolymer transport system component
LTGEIRALAADGFLVASSSTGQIAFVKGDPRAIWMMGPSGESPHQIGTAPAGSGFVNLAWSPDGTRLVSLAVRPQDFRQAVIQVDDVRRRVSVPVLTDIRVSAAAWLSNSQLIFAKGAAPPQQESYALWALTIDPQTSQPVGAPTLLTSWFSQSVGSISVSQDGHRVLLTKGRTRGNVYVGDLSAADDTLSNVRQLTLDDRVNWPSGWTADGRAVLFHSDRNGDFDLFRQGLSDREAQPVLLGTEEVRSARVTPDGRWVLFLTLGGADPATHATRVRLMRMPVGGGPAEPVLEATGNWGRGEATIGVDGDYNWSYPDYRCAAALRPAPCLIAEDSGDGHTVFTAFDPVRGRVGEVARVEAPAPFLAWDLSRDGSRIAAAPFSMFGGPPAPLRALTLSSKTWREIPLPNWHNPTGVAWSANGADLIVTNFAIRGGTLLDVDSSNRVRVLRELVGKGGFFASPRVSPDGRQLAFAEATSGSNVWVLRLDSR